MKDEDKTKSQLIAELRELRSRKSALIQLPKDTQRIALGLTRFYFENISIGILQLAKDGHIVNASPYAADMLGYTVKELTILSIFDIDPYMSADTMETDLETLAACEWDSFETVHLKKDGSQIPVEITSNRMEYEGQPYAFVFIKDITSRKRMEKKLRRNERMLRRIMDIVPSMIFVKNKAGRFLMVNRAIAQSLGMTAEELEGRLHRDVHPNPDEVEQMLADDRRALESGKKILIVEEPYQDITGDKRWFQTIKIPCDDDDFGEPAVVGLAMDITERKKNEEKLHRLINELKESEERFRALHNASFGGIMIHDLGYILECNKGLSEITGYSVDELIGMDGMLLIAQRSRKMVMEMVVAGNQEPYEAIGVRKTGEEYPIRLAARNIPYKGRQVRTVEFRDITQQKKLEEMMIQGEKMLSVGGLAAGMAHEINNPLAGMMQTANVMKSRLNDLSIPANLKVADEVGVSVEKIRAFMERRDILRMIEAINESGRRMAEIVNNMLSFARKSDTAFANCDPIQLMDRTLELANTDYDLKKQQDFKTIKIVKEYEEHLPMVPCEGAKIQQVLLNILRNGAQAMQNSDRDSREISCFVLRLIGEKDMLRIEIQDNGPGMDDAVRSRIFEPFFTTKPVGVGTGLGLSVSYFIITQNHGGTLDVVSSPGRGAKFIIRLPLEK